MSGTIQLKLACWQKVHSVPSRKVYILMWNVMLCATNISDLNCLKISKQ